MAKNSVALKISITAVFAAFCCVCTMISVPLPIGYFNLGDIFSLLAGWLLGPFGALAAGLGGAIADLILGFVQYAPATFVIKSCLALVAFYLYKALRKLIKGKKTAPISRAVSAIAGECVMVGGYFIYEYTVLGYGMGAAASIPGNLIQAAAGIIGGVAISSVLFASPRISKIFDNKNS